MEISLLFIDDDPVYHKLVNQQIKQSGISAKYQCFLHVSEALSYILDNNTIDALPDLVFLDLNMPLISGWGFLELFEAISHRLAKQVDVVILTSSVSAEDKDRAMEYNCVKGFFNKPFTYKLLEDILNSPFIFTEL